MACLGIGLCVALHSGAGGVGEKVTLYPDEKGKNSARRIAKIAEKYENGGFTVSVYLDKIKGE